MILLKKEYVYGLLLLFCAGTGMQTSALSEYMSTGGYILTGAYGGTRTVLLDSTGNIAYQWDHNDLPYRLNGYSCYLLKNGNLLRTAIVPEGSVPKEMAPRQGVIEEIDPAGKVVWRHILANDTFMTHHDIKPLYTNTGELHVLAASFIVQTKADLKATCVDTNLLRGMANPVFMLSEKIIEIKPRLPEGGDVVWEWRMPDHVICGDSAAAHPELISGTITSQLWAGYKQWVHLNGLDYHPKLDMILFSSRLFSELFVIDHGTTTAEAAGHTGGRRGKGGDILYRWGKPANYKMSGATTINVLHCVNWIPEGYPGAGNIIFFHNNAGGMPGMGGGTQSQVIEIKPPMDGNGNFIREQGKPFGPAEPTWIYAPTSNFSSFAMSSAFRLPNGNTLAHLAYPSSSGGMNISGNSVLVEIDRDKNVVWTDTIELKGEKVEAGSGQVYNPAKIMYYEKTYPGIQRLLSGSSSLKKKGMCYSKTPVVRYSTGAGRLEFLNVKNSEIGIFDFQGKKVAYKTSADDGFVFNTVCLAAGIYHIIVDAGKRGVVTKKVSVWK